jgi:hypothetical protein
MFTVLVIRLREVSYAHQGVHAATALLTHPANHTMMGEAEKGIALAISQTTLVRTSSPLAD